MQAEIDPAEPQKAKRRGRRKGAAKEHPASNLTIGAFLLVMGLVFGVGDLGDAWEDHRLVTDGVRAQGVVTQVDFERKRKRGMKKVISVSYEDDSRVGHSVTYTEPYRSKEEGPTSDVYEEMVGSKVTLFYDRSYPGKAVVEGDEISFGLAVFRGGFLILLSLMFLVPGIRGVRKKKKAAPQATDVDSPKASTSSGT